MRRTLLSLILMLALAALVGVASPASADHHLCGDGVINDGEQCDPNAVPTGCPAGESCYPYDAESGLSACTCGGATEECGNGLVELGEDCDDGNTADGDCCDASCFFEGAGTACGPLFVCDGTGTCAPACGNGEVDLAVGEDCDPGSPVPDDCCDDVSCTFEGPGSACGPSEVCDGAGTCEPVADFDSDGVQDSVDNCTLAANPLQEDTDGDGHGNACDPDLNNDCLVNFTDLAGLKAVVFTSDPDADFNSDGYVNFIDLGIMKSLFFNSPTPGPGPSAFGICSAG